MSIVPFLLDGWHEQSTWGDDGGYFYAQLTHNGQPSGEEPEVWIMPGARFSTCTTAPTLAATIAATLSMDVDVVLRAMSSGVALVECRGAARTCAALGLPQPPPTPVLVEAAAAQPSTATGSTSTSASSS